MNIFLLNGLLNCLLKCVEELKCVSIKSGCPFYDTNH